MSETTPRSGNYELQQEFLVQEQARISAELFEKGVTSRIVAVVPRGSGAIADVSDTGQLNLLFVPGIKMVNDRGHKERQLSLVAVTIDPEQQSRSYSYFRLGRIDDSGMFYPYPGVPPEDAEIVLGAANELDGLRTARILPNMSSSLMSVDNPNTAITAFPPADQT